MDLCGVAGSQGVVRVRSAEFIKLKQMKIWQCGGRALHRKWVLCEGKGTLTLEPHNSVSLCLLYPRVCLDLLESPSRKSTLLARLPARSQLSPPEGASSAGGATGRVRLAHSPRLKLYGGECSIQERCHLWAVWERDSAPGLWKLALYLSR